MKKIIGIIFLLVCVSSYGQGPIYPKRVQTDSITTRSNNSDLPIYGRGTGTVVIEGLSYPTADGTNGQALVTNGSGVLSFSTIGGGDVTKVGTPLNNQIGVWTGDGTIEGDANFTWTGTTLELETSTRSLRFMPGSNNFLGAGPSIYGDEFNSNNPGLFFGAYTNDDTGTDPLMVFTSRKSGNNDVVVRPLFGFYNNETSVYEIDVNGTHDYKSNDVINIGSVNGLVSAATGNEVLFDFAGTVNKSTSGNYTGIKLNVTETSAPGASDKLLDLQVGGTSLFSVTNGGALAGSGGFLPISGALNCNDYDSQGDATFQSTDDLFITSGSGTLEITSTTIDLIGNATLSGGMTVGSPTGGNKGAGTINAQAVYDDNVLLTDYVFEKEFTGKTVDERFADFERKSLKEEIEFAHTYYHLSTMTGRKEWEKERPSDGEIISELWKTVEVQFLYIKELNERIEKLEQQ